MLKNAWNVEDDSIVLTGEVDPIREEYDLRGRRGESEGHSKQVTATVVIHPGPFHSQFIPSTPTVSKNKGRKCPVFSECTMLFSFQTSEFSPLIVSRHLSTSRSLALDITRDLVYLSSTLVGL